MILISIGGAQRIDAENLQHRLDLLKIKISLYTNLYILHELVPMFRNGMGKLLANMI